MMSPRQPSTVPALEIIQLAAEPGAVGTDELDRSPAKTKRYRSNLNALRSRSNVAHAKEPLTPDPPLRARTQEPGNG